MVKLPLTSNTFTDESQIIPSEWQAVHVGQVSHMIRQNENVHFKSAPTKKAVDNGLHIFWYSQIC